MATGAVRACPSIVRIWMMTTLLVAIAIVFARRDEPPVQPVRPSLHELVAVRRLEAHDAAVRSNADAKLRCERHQVARRRTFDVLYGAAPATTGAAFGDVRIGAELRRAPQSAFDIFSDERGGVTIAAYARVAAGTPAQCAPNEDPDVFCPFECHDDAAADCSELASQLDRAWGRSEHDAWLDGTHRIRATVRVDRDCELRLQRYVPPRAWLAMSASAEVPLALVGAPMTRLPAYAEAAYNPLPLARYRWQLTVTGDHVREAWIDAYVDGGLIVRLSVRGKLDEIGGADEIYALARPFLGTHVTLETGTGWFQLEAFVSARVLQ